jgi:hypothetical protein
MASGDSIQIPHQILANRKASSYRASVRSETDKAKLQSLLSALGSAVKSKGTAYLSGGGCAVIYGWRETTIDVDLHFDPEPVFLFEAIRDLKQQLDMNIELAWPMHFIPAPAGWRERCIFIGQYGHLTYYHCDFYAQALAKIERHHSHDAKDVQAMLNLGLVEKSRLWQAFDSIVPGLLRFPALNEERFRDKMRTALGDHP